MLRKRSRTSAALAAAAAAALCLPGAASASGFHQHAPVQASLTVTYRQDWQVLKPTDHGCQPLGGGSVTLRGESSGTRRARLDEWQDDPFVARRAGISMPLRFTYDPTDGTTSRTPPNPQFQDPEYGCGPPEPKTCRRFDLGTFTASIAGAKGLVLPRVPEDLRAPDGLDDDTCWTPGLGRLRVQDVRAAWPSQRPAAFNRAGVHRVHSVAHMRTQTFRDPIIGDQRRVQITVTIDLVYRMPTHPGWKLSA